VKVKAIPVTGRGGSYGCEKSRLPRFLGNRLSDSGEVDSLKRQAVPVTDRGGSYGCEKSRLPHFLGNRLTDSGKVVSLTRLPPFTPQEDSWYSFLLEAQLTPGS
jgi:hypothetical protein